MSVEKSIEEAIAAANRHGKESEPEHEIGDLESIIWTLANHLNMDFEDDIIEAIEEVTWGKE